MKKTSTLKKTVKLNATEIVAFVDSLSEEQAKDLLKIVVQSIIA